MNGTINLILVNTHMERLHELCNACSGVVLAFSLIFLLSQFPKVNPVWIVWFVNLCWGIESMTPYECKKNHTREKLVLNHFNKRWKDEVIAPFEDFPAYYSLLQKWFCKGSSFRIAFIHHKAMQLCM